MEKKNIDYTKEHQYQDPELMEFDHLIKRLPEVVKTKLMIGRVFNSIHLKMNRGENYQGILDSVFTSLDSVIPFDRIGIAILEDEGESIRLNWVMSKLPIKYLKSDFKAPMWESSLRLVIQTRKPRILPDLKEFYKAHPNSKSTEYALKDGIRSSLTFPLIVHNNPIGVIFFSSGMVNTYHDAHIDLFSEIAQGLSLIIDQSLSKQSLDESNSNEKIFRESIHDLNNPLSIIKGTLSLIPRNEWFKQLSENSKKTFDILNRNCDSMQNLIRDLCNMSQSKSEKHSIHSINKSIDDFIREVVSDSEGMASRKDIRISLSKSAGVPKEAKFDPYILKVALDNIVSNAIKFSKEKTNVSISVSFDANSNRLKFAVTDEGQGIPEGELEKLFKEFGKTSVRPTAGEHSSGIGLSNVKRLIEIHGGEVFVNSKFGVGSTFGFWIPITSSPLH